jgi:hypothetical protein
MFGAFTGNTYGSNGNAKDFGFINGSTWNWGFPFTVIMAGQNNYQNSNTIGLVNDNWASAALTTTTYSSGANFIYGVGVYGSTPTTYMYQNYTQVSSLGTYEPAFPLNLGYNTQADTSVNITSQWTRLRALPPNDAMPTFTINAVV